MEKIMFPNYKKNIIGISATLLQYCGVKNSYPKIKELKQELRKKYKNVVFFVFDGMGAHAVDTFLRKNSFLRKNMITTLSSTFPPTTTAATSSYWSCSYPVEHKWLGWSMYLKELDKTIDIFTNRDTYTCEKLEQKNVMKIYHPYESMFKKVNDLSKPKVKIYGVFPDYFDQDFEYTKYKNFNQVFNKIQIILDEKKPKRKLVVTYCEEPDSKMHVCGYSSTEAKRYIKKINKRLSEFLENNPDTLIIVSADHGQIDVGKTYRLEDYEDLCACFNRPPSFESRSMNFSIKEDKKEEFEKLFKQYFGKKFKLFKIEEVIRRKMFGPGDYSNIEEFLGDYIACAISDAILKYSPTFEDGFCFLGHHAGLLEQEMRVPLILAGNKPED